MINRKLIFLSVFAGVSFQFSFLQKQSSAQVLGADRLQIHGSLSLIQALKTGLNENGMVRSAGADAKAALAATRIARSQKLPQISANTYLTYGDFSNIFTSAAGVTPMNNLLAPSQGYADQNLTLSLPIFTGGRLENQERAASDRERAAVLDVAGMRSEIGMKIKEAYYRALLAVENVKSAQSRVDAAAELVKNSQSLFDAGKGLEASVQRVQAEQADAQRALTTVRNDLAKSLLDLKVVMGVRLDSDITLSDVLAFSSPSGGLTDQLADAARFRPELLSARKRAEAAAHITSSVRGSQGAQIYASAMADGLTSHPNGSREGYSVGLVLSLPLVDGGQRRAETDQARAQEVRSKNELRDMELQVANEVQQAWLDVQTAVENYRTAQVALVAAQSAYDVTALRVQNQKGLLVEQLDALAALTRARGSVSQALYDHSVALAQLQRAVGRSDR